MNTQTAEDRKALKEWEGIVREQMRLIQTPDQETTAQRAARITRLEANPEEWFRYYFPNFCKAEEAAFHRSSARRVLSSRRHWELRIWARGLAKSVRTMMEVLFMVLVQKKMRNILLISHNLDNAERLLTPYRIALDSNPRIKADYGNQKGASRWSSNEFITQSGVAFTALGAGQSPRGTRAEEARVDGLLIDDIDTDEECRNEQRVKEKFKWLQEAVLPTVDISGEYWILMNGNLISKTSCVEYAKRLASFIHQINIRDAKGRSSWPQKNAEEDIDQMLKLLSHNSAQKEYFNNPVSEGEVFTSMQYKAMRPLRDYRFLVCYTDPSFKDAKTNDFKATVLVGRYKDEYHVLRAWCDQTTIANMIGWHYEAEDMVGGIVPIYHLMEANFMQDSIIAEFHAEGLRRGKVIPIKGDERKKPDKFTRIEALLEPLNRNSKLWLNAKYEEERHMRNLHEQFLALQPGSRAHDDAPDATEGAVFFLNRKSVSLEPDSFHVNRPRKNPKRF